MRYGDDGRFPKDTAVLVWYRPRGREKVGRAWWASLPA